MEDVKTPHQRKAPATPFLPSALAKWLIEQELGDLMSVIANADQHDTWSVDRDPTIIGREMQSLWSVLANPTAASSEPVDTNRLSSDLTYVLGYLRTSQSIQLLCLLSARWPGIVDNLLGEKLPARSPGQSHVESAVLANRLLHLVRHQAAPRIFGPDRLSEVRAAIVAARLAGRNS